MCIDDKQQLLDFGLKLRETLNTFNISRKEVATSLGIHINTLNHWIVGDFQPKLVDLQKLNLFFKTKKISIILNLFPDWEDD